MSEAGERSWIDDPDVVLFVTDDETLAIGAVEQHGLGEAAGRLFGRSKEAVKADWSKALDQMRFFLDGLSPSAHGYEATEVTFELAFTAKGGVAFIAEAGLSSSVSVKFERKTDPAPASGPGQ